MIIDEGPFDISAQFLEGLVDAMAIFGAALHEFDSISVGEMMGLLEGDFPLGLEIALVAEEQDPGLLIGGVGEVLHPLLCMRGCVHTELKDYLSSREKTTRTPWEFR